MIGPKLTPAGYNAGFPKKNSTMRVSQFFISTLKEAPAEAELASHRLMLRAGMIKRLAAGIYTWMPLGLRVLRKVEAIVREEMNRAGAIELLMPVVQPAELWQETGRWDKYGPELLRLKDRHERDFIVRPTSEEVITDIARKELTSYQQLPLNLYQIQTKFRDEIRPRFGVMRAREFIMKDAYSFDVDKAAMLTSRTRRCTTPTRASSRGWGSSSARSRPTPAQIGGSASHEFQVLADSGEDAIAWCPASDYAANVELAEALAPPRSRGPRRRSRWQKVPTPGKSTCEESPRCSACRSRARSSASCSSARRTRVHMLLVRGDHMRQRGQDRQASGPRAAGAGRAKPRSSPRPAASPGYLGPVGIPADMPLIVDRTVAVMADFVCGANEPDFHLRGVNFGRDCREPDRVADLRNVVEGDPSPDGKGTLEILRGIEVGHVFALGDRLFGGAWAQLISTPAVNRRPWRWAATASASPGSSPPRSSRTTTTGHHLARRRWPRSPWPSPPSATTATRRSRRSPTGCTTSSTAAGVEVLLDDRGERPGVMFADLELIGIPHRDHHRRSRPEGRQGRVPGAGATRRRRRCPWPRSPPSSRGKLAA